MPLKLTLRPKEKFFLNGAVLENGDNRADLTLLNDAAILREKDILTEEAVNTVCKQIYFLIQLIYIDPANLGDYQAKLEILLAEVAQALPDSVADLVQIKELVSTADYYHAMKSARKLISIEKELLDNVR